MPTSWASTSNPGIYVCRCGQTNAAMGEPAVKALISEYLTHMKMAHPDLPEITKRRVGGRAA